MSSDAATVHPSVVAEPQLYGLLAEFSGPQELLDAAAKVRAAGYTDWDSHSPFPVHGMEKTMGIKPTILPWLVLGGGVSGIVGALALAAFCNGFDYPLVFSGKPYWGMPPHVFIAFPAMILLGSVTSVFGFMALAGLPRFYHPLFTSKRFQKVTDDGFFISISAQDPRFSVRWTGEMLRGIGAIAVEEIKD